MDDDWWYPYFRKPPVRNILESCQMSESGLFRIDNENNKGTADPALPDFHARFYTPGYNQHGPRNETPLCGDLKWTIILRVVTKVA